MNRLTKTTKILLFTSLALLVLFSAYPYLVLITKILFPLPVKEFTTKYFTGIFDSPSTLLAIKNTIFISLGSGIFSTLLALPLSWLLTRTNIIGGSKFRSLFCLPYAIPPYIGAMAWIYLANPKTGLLNSILGSGTLDVYTYPGLIWVLSSFFYTFVLLSLLSALDRMDPSLEEAARLSGASPLRVFFDITLPIIRPALLSGILLVILAAAASFGVPALIGTPGNIYLMTTRIYTFQKMGSISGIYTAGALAFFLLGFAVIAMTANQFLARKHFKTVAGKIVRPSLIDLKGKRIPIFFIMLSLFTILFVLPMFGILISSLSKVQGSLTFDNMGFQNFYRVFFEVDETPRALWNSFKLAFAAASIATFWGFFISYFNNRTEYRGKKLTEILVALPYATPGTVLGLCLILAFGQRIFGLNFSLYNTLTLIVFAYLIKYLNFSVRTTNDGIAQIDTVLEEAARVSGANFFTTIRTIWIPLLKPVLISSWFLVFMPCFSELTMTILLSGPGLETLGTLIFQLQEYADASGGGAAVLALMTVIFVAVINYFVKFISKGKYGL